MTEKASVKCRAEICCQKTLPFLPQYTNPCWNESLDDLSKIDYAHNKVAQDWYEGLLKAHEQDIVSRYEQGQHWRFRCLPYVYVIGECHRTNHDTMSLT